MSVLNNYSYAHEQLAAIKAGKVTSRELLEQQIAHIERNNPILNAVVSLNIPAAREAADAADKVVRNGGKTGALHGIALTVKDTWEVPGMVCAAGAPEYAQYRPTTAATAVARLQQAGAIILGKTNVPYLAGDVQSLGIRI